MDCSDREVSVIRGPHIIVVFDNGDRNTGEQSKLGAKSALRLSPSVICTEAFASCCMQLVQSASHFHDFCILYYLYSRNLNESSICSG
jgi:hypothetical protein